MILPLRPAHAEWPSDPNVNVPLCTASKNQVVSSIVSDGAGGAIVAWIDARSGTDSDIYATHVTWAGSVDPAWPVNGVVLCAAARNQDRPDMCSDGAGGAILTWSDHRSGTSLDIYAQRVTAAGAVQWATNGVALCSAAGDQRNPRVIADGAGGAIVAWDDLRLLETPSRGDIYAQRIDGAGTLQWTPDGVSVCAAPENQSIPMLCPSGSGGAIVVWGDNRSAASDLYAQRLSATGAPLWAVDGLPVCLGEGANQQVLSDGADGAIVAWQDYGEGASSSENIVAQRINSSGTRQWSGNGTPLCTATDWQLHPSMVSDGAGGAVVSWQDHRNGANFDIYAQRVNAAGVPLWDGGGIAITTADSDQQFPVMASDGAGGAIVTWFNDRGDTNLDIYARRVSAAGAPLWSANGVALCTAADGQFYPLVLSDESGGAIVTWRDRRSGTEYDIYAQNVHANGTLGVPLVSTPPFSIARGLALRSVQPNPSAGDLQVSFSLLDSAPAILELYDLTGRRIESRSVGNLGPGTHVSALTLRQAALPPGVYCVTLTQGNQRAFKRVSIVR